MNKYFMFLILAYLAVVMAACGKTGSSGPKGEEGEAGAQGNPGVDVSTVNVIQLCPGATTYPGVFVEVAICINHELYGVYTSPAFLTLIPPGTYNSTAIGSACSLTVADDCVVTN